MGEGIFLFPICLRHRSRIEVAVFSERGIHYNVVCVFEETLSFSLLILHSHRHHSRSNSHGEMLGFLLQYYCAVVVDLIVVVDSDSDSDSGSDSDSDSDSVVVDSDVVVHCVVVVGCVVCVVPVVSPFPNHSEGVQVEN